MSASPSIPQLTEATPARHEPLGLHLSGFGDAWQTRWQVIVWSLVALGIAVRLVRYALRFPLWGDECMLANNFLTRDYAGLLEPLDYTQVAPLGYLWAQKAAVDLLGFSEWSLRLVALLGGLASLPLFAHVAGRVLRGLPHALAVGIFAVAYYPLRHAAEVKPYATDMFWSLLLLALAIEWWRRPEQSRWLWALAVAAPLAVLCSFPVVFVGGGITLGLAVCVLRQGNRNAWLAFGAYQAALVGTFALVAWLNAAAQYEENPSMAGTHWSTSFPPTELARLPLWLLEAHTGEMFAYPVGGENGGSTLTTICCLIAALVFWRQDRKALVGIALGTFALALLAATVRGYPYADNERLVQYLAPIICLFAGLGAAAMFSWIRSAVWQRHGALAYLALLVALAVGTLAKDVVQPYKSPFDAMHQGFARWFWNQGVETPELLCVQTDLQQPLSPHCPQYFCSQVIYSPRHALKNRQSVADPLKELRPITAVGFWRDFDSEGQQRLQTWVESMRPTYRLVHIDRHDVMLGDELNQPWAIHYEVYHFEPRTHASSEVADDRVGRPLLR